ncbi:GNAT family N-acetyltransferase [Burkholderia lata]|uniref:N-acetyltransferase GCN5 n=1 Tax=Burkholderia lata (strain ATCC 17760 / DSM 23089 / LMG 22485 / NCIMB 9086 / R18194 / 383) TaxID=482957 RepID=A0A6P2TT49_BURL3|nr:GNAT family N-acetyltransferase [Burkholderia lata]VWC63722.1 N-acetyltransferase GCN5 [Burkholderia lata]
MLMLTLHRLSGESESDRANVRRVFFESPSYTQRVEGRLPAEEDVDDFFVGKPAGKDAADKSVFGLFAGKDMIGCADVIRAYPTDDCLWIGLLLFSDGHRRRGYGKAAVALLAEMAREWGHRTVQLAVISTNPDAEAFWRREGFAEIRRTVNPRFTGDVIVMQRQIR